MNRYNHAVMQTLEEQLQRGPRRLRLRQLLQIDFLLSVIEVDREYPYDFVCHALTGFRRPWTREEPARLLDGERLAGDLITLAENLSADARLFAANWPEPLFSAPDLARRFDVSVKTIFRWRRRGLAGWRFRGTDERVRWLCPERCVRRFVTRNSALVSRAGRFSQLSQSERERIVARAVELARGSDLTINALAKIMSAETGRSPETIRLIVKRSAVVHPTIRGVNRTAPPDETVGPQLAIWEAYQEGANVDALARRFGQSVSAIYATVTRMRASALRAQRIDFVPSAEFEVADADDQILRAALLEPVRQPATPGRSRECAALPPYLANLFRVPLLTRAGERSLFRKMNYLKYKAHVLQQQLDPETASAIELDRIEDLRDQAVRVRNEIVQANLRLVVSIARQHVAAGRDLFELISDGNFSLMQAVERFDYSRGFKFCTYGTWAIRNNFVRSSENERRYAARCQTGRVERLDTASAREPMLPDDERTNRLRTAVDGLLARLADRERVILRRHFGLGAHGEPQSLEEIGRHFNLSKERIRQLEVKAISRLRSGWGADVDRWLDE